jgi:hypothetical protein
MPLEPRQWSPLPKPPPRQKAKKKPFKRSRIRRVSKGRAKDMKVYSERRRAFLEAHPWCQIWLKRRGISEDVVRESQMMLGSRAIVTGNDPVDGFSAWQVGWIPASCDVHHSKGRTGKNYLDETTWVAASRDEHEWAHRHPSQARELGLLV